MSRERRETSGLPIACSLTPAQQAAMREELGTGDGPVTNEVTGPEGTREFLSSLIGGLPGPPGR